MRTPLTPPSLPLHRTPGDRFDELVLDAVEQLEGRWSQQLAGVEFAVEPVPPDDEPSADGEPVALARLIPGRTGAGAPDEPARIVFYRRPLEARGRHPEELAELILDVLIHEVARLLQLTPEEIDPEGHGPEA